MLQQLEVVPKAPGSVTSKQVRAWIEAGNPLSVIDVLVTPEIAKTILEYNRPGEANRPVTRAGVKAVAFALMRAEWTNTGEPIIMSDERLLNDGQHRLTAVVETGIAVPMDLRFGIARAAYPATNSGGSRSAGQALSGMGLTNTMRLAAVLRIGLAYEDGLPSSLRWRMPNARIAEALHRWPDAVQGARVCGTMPKPFRVSMVGGLAFLAGRSARERLVTAFFDELKTGIGKASSPPMRLREALLAAGLSREETQRASGLALGILAWNAYRRGETIKANALAWASGDPFPKMERLKL
jgi:hypothetical protein